LDWYQGPGKVDQKNAKTPSLVTTPPEVPKSKQKKIFNLQFKTCWIHRGFEQLSSSIAWRVIVLQTFLKLQKSGPGETYDVQHIFPGEKKFSRGGLCLPLWPSCLRASFKNIIM